MKKKKTCTRSSLSLTAVTSVSTRMALASANFSAAGHIRLFTFTESPINLANRARTVLTTSNFATRVTGVKDEASAYNVVNRASHLFHQVVDLGAEIALHTVRQEVGESLHHPSNFGPAQPQPLEESNLKGNVRRLSDGVRLFGNEADNDLQGMSTRERVSNW